MARRSPAASQLRRAASSSWATPTTAMISPTSTQFVGRLAGGRCAGHGQPLLPAASPRAPCRGTTAISAIRCSAFSAGCSSAPKPRDFHCGLRGFDREAILGLNLRTTGMEFASEMLVKATLSGLERRRSADNAERRMAARGRRICARSATAGGICASCCCFRRAGCFSIRAMRCSQLGLFLGAFLIRGPVNVSPTIVLDVHTFLVAAMCILVGLQAVSFAIIGRRFASRYGFIPRSETFDRALEALTLERILLAAVVLVAGRPWRADLGLRRNGRNAASGRCRCRARCAP